MQGVILGSIALLWACLGYCRESRFAAACCLKKERPDVGVFSGEWKMADDGCIYVCAFWAGEERGKNAIMDNQSMEAFWYLSWASVSSFDASAKSPVQQ
jgi:hypothetical protein